MGKFKSNWDDLYEAMPWEKAADRYLSICMSKKDAGFIDKVDEILAADLAANIKDIILELYKLSKEELERKLAEERHIGSVYEKFADEYMELMWEEDNEEMQDIYINLSKSYRANWKRSMKMQFALQVVLDNKKGV